MSSNQQLNEINELTINCLWVVFTTYWIFLTPLSLYGAYQFYKLRHITFIQKRHPRFVVIMVILINLYPSIARPIADLFPYYFNIDELGPTMVAMTNLTHISNILFAVRLWLLYYDYTYSEQSLAIKWKQLILKQRTIKPWTMRYPWTGNVLIITILAFLVLIIYESVIVTGILLNGYMSINITQILPFCTFIFIACVGFRIRKCTDMFMIQKEFKVSGIGWIFIIMSYITMIMIFSNPATMGRRIMVNLICCLANYLVTYVATFWTIRQYQKQHMFHLTLQERKSTNAIEYIEHRLTLDQILCTNDGFQLFANHLVKEFSIENLFFVYEMVQIKTELITHNMIEESDIGMMMKIDFSIINGFKRTDAYIFNLDELKNNIEYIMNQYIYDCSEYCVNISSVTRRKLMDEYEDLESNMNNTMELEMVSVDTVSPNVNLEVSTVNDAAKRLSNCRQIERERIEDLIKKYLSIFDDAMEEVITLMKKDSLIRFYETREYETMSTDRKSVCATTL